MDISTNYEQHKDITYRETKSKLSSSSSESDEDDDNLSWKRRAISRKSKSGNEPSMEAVPSRIPTHPLQEEFCVLTEDRLSRKRKPNTIWAGILQEQSLTENLGHCDIEHKDLNGWDRACETYDFTRRELDLRPDPEEIDMFTDSLEQYDIEKEQSKEKSNVKECLGPSISKDLITSSADKINQRIGMDIARKLNETKHDLIVRVVKILGVEKAEELYNKTENVEESGGMLILNGQRRRTPGGVFLQLLKNDNDITKKQKDEIFIDDRREKEIKKREIKRAQRRRRAEKLKTAREKMEIENSLQELKPLPCVEELAVKRSNLDCFDTEIKTGIKSDLQSAVKEEPHIEIKEEELEEGEIID
ncbi:phosphorylated adapter RNA export protein-like [Limulus polyphemus]|uniref:Phosphorylated adapter RNA export protein n=1 Tax=Limulus polyphemus TaxID=6850 RepID=A0ABM1BFR8_LIMPO|nr:phosphorylated adapter RNA export protein-like [Limulus polyphemus]XP_022249029.1 phosphorylated adapter RNA export protein-like [Limulus polyphemus]